MNVLYKAGKKWKSSAKLDELASAEREDDRMLAVLEHQSQENREKEENVSEGFCKAEGKRQDFW